MKYRWDLEKLRYRRKLLEEIVRQTNDANIKYNAQEQASVYTEMLRTAKKKSTSMDNLDTTFENLTIEELINEVMKAYVPHNFPFINVLLQSFFPINEYSTNALCYDNITVTTNDELVTLTRDFFKRKTPSYVAKEFDNILAQGDIINISYSKSDSIYSGYILCDYFLNKKYIFVGRNNKLCDLYILPHEAFHYIFRDRDAALTGMFDTYYLTEVEGMFSNILFGEYFQENTNPKVNFFSDYSLGLFKNHINDLVTRNTLLDSLKENKRIRLSKVNKYLNYFGVAPFKDEKELIPYLSMPEEDVIKYALSYLTAIDLYYMYKKNPEDAFYALSCITYIKQTNDIFTILRNNGITFMDDNYTNLKKYIKSRNN